MRAPNAKLRAGAENDGRKRYYDPKFEATAVRVLPGEHYVTDDPDEMIVTILGSCVAACIRDPVLGVAGMNHFMLPGGEAEDWGGASAAMRYGDYAMEMLINDLMRRGAKRSRLEVKVFGGGRIGRMRSSVGEKNARFVLNYLRHEGMEPVAADLGGDAARRIHYFAGTGKVKRLSLRSLDETRLRAEEDSYNKKMAAPAPAGDIELFD